MATKHQALAKITRTAKSAAIAADRAEAAKDARDEAIYQARQGKDPASYQELAEASGITKDRISQILQVQRAKHGPRIAD